MTDQSDIRELLANSRLFKGFDPAVIDGIVPLFSPCHFAEDSLVCLKGDDSDCVYVIAEGTAEVSVSSSDGKIVVLGTLSRGDVFGEVGLLDHGPRTANVTATSDVTFYRLDSKDFDKVTSMFGEPEWRALTSYICFLFRNVTNNLEETVFLDASIRVARKLRGLYEKDGDKAQNRFSVSISQENLGRMAGLSREATNKALSRLEDMGLIAREYKSIILPDVSLFLKTLDDDDL
ncbi:MAG: Crp/Fnr family transcriptional regulator [Rhodospirillales bacterium]|nr:Crp/Fnr family transcriptional regulator [Rhodospirillales bacterium]MCB9996755.1 Crp/Fnr family transcriptional regulator [Rhodospirillales bacterium]